MGRHPVSRLVIARPFRPPQPPCFLIPPHLVFPSERAGEPERAMPGKAPNRISFVPTGIKGSPHRRSSSRRRRQAVARLATAIAQSPAAQPTPVPPTKVRQEQDGSWRETHLSTKRPCHA